MKFTDGSTTSNSSGASLFSSSDFDWADQYLKEQKKRESQQRIDALTQQSAQFKKEASTGGIIKNTLKGMGSAVVNTAKMVGNQAKYVVQHPVNAAKTVGKTLTTSEKAASEDISQAAASYALTPGIEKKNKAATESNNRIMAEVNKLREKKPVGYKAKVTTLLGMMNNPYKENNVENIATDGKGYKTNAQVLGDFAGVALDAVTGGSGFSKLAKTGKFAKGGSAIINAAKEGVIKGTAKATGMGAVYGADQALQEGKTSVRDIANSAGTGALFGGGLMLGGKLVAKAGGSIIKRIVNGKGTGIADRVTQEAVTQVPEQASKHSFNVEWKSGAKNFAQTGSDGKTTITLRSNAPEATVWHETAHALDRQNPGLRDSLSGEITAVTGSKSVTNEDMGNAFKKLAQKPGLKEQYPGISGIMDSVTLPDEINKKYSLGGKDLKVTPGLSPESARLERDTQIRARDNYESFKQQYLEKNTVKDAQGNTTSVLLNTDEWRPLFPEYKGTNSSDVHEASSYLNNRLYKETLEAQKGKGNNTIAFYAGGGGSGKGSAVSQYFDESQYPIRLDGTFANYEKNLTKLQEAKAAGYNVEMIFVDRNPVAAYENVVNRALKTRRTVQMDRAIEDNINAREGILKMIQDNPDIKVNIVDNNYGKGEARLLKDRAEQIDFLSKNSYNKDEIRKTVYDATNARIQSGEVPSDIAEGLVGKGTANDRQLQLRSVEGNAGQQGANVGASGSDLSGTLSKTEQVGGSDFTIGKYYKGSATDRYARQINAQAINTTDDIAELGQQVHDEYTKFFQDVKGGVKPNEVTLKQAEALGWTVDKIKNIPENALLNDAQTAAVAQIKADLVLQLAEATRAFQKTGSEETKGLMKDLLAKVVSTDATLKRSEIQLGRATQIKNAVPIPREFDDDALFETLKKSGIEGVSDMAGAVRASDKVVEATKGSKVWEAVNQVLNAPRSIMSSVDLSAALRQGLLLTSRPKQFIPAFVQMFKAAASEKGFKEIQDKIASRPTRQLMEKAKLALTDVQGGLTKREEQFMSSWVDKIPGIGMVTRMSSRAYTGFLNKIRADVFDDLVNKAEILGRNPKGDDKLLKDIATFVNTASGRGSIGKLETAAPILNGLFFSPRLMASRLQTLNPVYYAKLDPMVRKEALKSLVTLAGTAGTVLSLAKMGGAEVEIDPRSADFAKIKIGNTRLDILGGFQQPIRLASQVISGKIISSTTGKEMTLGEGYKPTTRFDVVMRFFEAKEAPIASLVSSLMKGETFNGEPVKLGEELRKRVIPMLIQDLAELYNEGGIPDLKYAPLAVFGVGVQTYGRNNPKLEQALNLPDNRSMLERMSGISEKDRGKELTPVLNKLSDERISLSVPTTSTKVRFKGDKESRNLTKGELKEYQMIYGKNLKAAISSKNEIIMRLTGDKLDNYINTIVSNARDKSKLELIKKR